jgi:exonuclease SbcC
MILNKVKLEDFISHKKTEIELGYGINVIVGPNGAGKTSVLDGISFALFNDAGRGKKENLINSKADKCKVALSFTEAGVEYDVDWVMERGGSAKGSLYRLKDGKRSLLVRGGERSVIPEVVKVLGIDKSMFLQSVYVRQGEIEKLVTALPGARKELISRLLGVEDLDRAWNGIKTVIQVYRDKQIALETELGRKPIVEKQISEAEAKSKNLDAQLVLKRKDLAEIKSDLGRFQAILEESKVKKKKFDALDKERGLLDQSISNFEKKLKEGKLELERAVAAERVVKDLQNEVIKLPFLEAYALGLSEKGTLELKQRKFLDKLEEIAQLEKIIASNKESHELFLAKEKLITEKNKARRSCEGADAALDKALKLLETRRKEEQKKTATLAKELEKYTLVLGEQVSGDNVQSVIDRVEKTFQESLKILDTRIMEIRAKKGVLAARIKELDENLSKFSSATEAKDCPTCETELGPERISHLMRKYTIEKGTAEKNVVKLNIDLKELEGECEEASQREKQVNAVSAERIHSLAADSKEASNQVASELIEIEDLSKQAETLKKLDSDLDRLEKEKDVFEEGAMEFDSAKRQLAKLPSQESIQEELSPIASALEEAAKVLESSIKQLEYEPRDPQKELKELRLKKQELDQNVTTADRRTEYELCVSATEGDLSKCRKQHSAALGAIEKLGYDEMEHEETQRKFDSKGEAMQKLEKDIAITGQEKMGFDQEACKCAEELKTLEGKAFKKKLVDKYIAVLNRIREAYGKDGIQKMIRARARPLLERSTRDLFERFNLAYSDIKIDDDYNISVLGSAGEQDIDQISGGERVALAIALRLAIAQVLSGKIETIIMDEPTTHLDEQRRKELVNILSSFFREGGRIIPQMLIITHHTEIEDVADTIYTIRKEDSYSIAEKNTFVHGQQ